MKVCDMCKREPEPFEFEGADGIETAYFVGVPKENEHPVVLTSDLEEKFMMVTHPSPAPHEYYWFWCTRCLEAFGQAQKDENSEEES